ncbi:MAG: hypothetical protein KDA49_08280 [Rhodospirillaceae bacterium]|nr:hypothetical protein [Rhodospirillaceae bacterium]MCA8932453.1 hypothetical protein [Rhodospirillaceae bacterium]
MPDAKLIYDAARERLHGTIDGAPVDLRAVSGGHRGAVDPGRWQSGPESWDRTKVGGPTPAGRYTIYWLGDYTSPTNKRFGLCCFLHPDPETKAWIDAAGRTWNDFLLHKPGAVGSEGCIIPWPMESYEALITRLAGEVDQPVGTLEVV